MHIAKQDDASLLMQLLYQLLGCVYRRVDHFRWVLPPSVEVAASERAAVIAIDHAVRIHHRHKLNNVVFS